MLKHERNDIKQHLIIRVDANTRIGSGHLMRCLALAQVWQDMGGHATFLMATEAEHLKRRLHSEGMEVVILPASPGSVNDALQTIDIALRKDASWIAADGYHFGSHYQRMIKEAGLPLLFIDDYSHAGHYYADVVLNQNSYAHEDMYTSREPDTHLLLGTSYVLLRMEFLKWAQWKRHIPETARKVLVTMGGGDADNVTLKIIKALKNVEIPDLEAKIVVGASNPHIDSLYNALLPDSMKKHSQSSGALRHMQILQNVRCMPDVMAWADLAVSAGGSTCWELAFMGLPNIIVVLADNQQKSSEEFNKSGVALRFGSHSKFSKSSFSKALETIAFDPTLRKTMSKTGRHLINGTGAKRIFTTLAERSKEGLSKVRFRIRPVSLSDAKLLWQWRNDPIVRSNSFHPDQTAIEDHIKWYKNKLSSPDTRIWILERNGVPVAQIRYERVDSDMAEISCSVASHYRSGGLGTKALVLTSNTARKELCVTRLKGIVFSSNEASVRVFSKAGFTCIGRKSISNIPCHIFERDYTTKAGMNDEALY